MVIICNLNQLKKFLSISLLFFLFGCTSTPSKDAYLRIRPPTSEMPAFHQDDKFGMKLALENYRFVVNPTNNLVNNFNFGNKNFYSIGDGDGKSLSGVDLSLFYSRYVFSTPLEFSASTDFIKSKLMLIDARNGGLGFVFTGNIAFYKSAFYTTSGVASFWNFESDGGAATKTIEDKVSVSGDGIERKIGTSLGYYFKKGSAFYIAYNQYEANLKMNASQSSNLEIYFKETLRGASHGAGFLWYMNQDKILISLSVDNVTTRWNDLELSRAIGRFDFSVEF